MEHPTTLRQSKQHENMLYSISTQIYSIFNLSSFTYVLYRNGILANYLFLIVCPEEAETFHAWTSKNLNKYALSSEYEINAVKLK